MTATEHSETLEEICQNAYNDKIAEPYTWSRLREIIIWNSFIWVVVFHVGVVATLCSYVFGLHSIPVKFQSILWILLYGWITGIGVTAGAHRLWAHRTYKANLPLRILLMISYSGIGGSPLYYWIRDHRVHHKYSETDADPHNAKRGFFFSHIGWSFIKRHPECVRRGREVDMTDIQADPVVAFQTKYASQLRLLFCFVIPTAIPVLFWKETLLHAILTQCSIRYILAMNCMLCVNSVAHLWGSRPYNRFINPAESAIVSILVMGEGSHNYHHTFPWDYKTSEFPYLSFNLTTLFIDGMAKLGWAYDRRKSSPELVEKVIRRIGYKSEAAKAQ